MVDVRTRIEILCPLDKVSQFSSNPDNATKWYVNIKSVEWKTPPPLMLGSRIAFIAHFLGRKLSYTYEVMAMDEKHFVMRTAEGPFPMQTTYEWKALDANRTEMLLRNHGQPTGFSKLMAPFMQRMMRKANEKDLEMLKQVLEGGATA